MNNAEKLKKVLSEIDGFKNKSISPGVVALKDKFINNISKRISDEENKYREVIKKETENKKQAISKEVDEYFKKFTEEKLDSKFKDILKGVQTTLSFNDKRNKKLSEELSKKSIENIESIKNTFSLMFDEKYSDYNDFKIKYSAFENSIGSKFKEIEELLKNIQPISGRNNEIEYKKDFSDLLEKFSNIEKDFKKSSQQYFEYGASLQLGVNSTSLGAIQALNFKNGTNTSVTITSNPATGFFDVVINAVGPTYGINTKVADYQLLNTDFGSGSIFIMNSGSAHIFTLPTAVNMVGHLGAPITIMKKGAGKVTIQANAGQTISDSSSGGTLYDDVSTETWSTITILAITTTQFVIISSDGTWSTT